MINGLRLWKTLNSYIFYFFFDFPITQNISGSFTESSLLLSLPVESTQPNSQINACPRPPIYVCLFVFLGVSYCNIFSSGKECSVHKQLQRQVSLPHHKLPKPSSQSPGFPKASFPNPLRISMSCLEDYSGSFVFFFPIISYKTCLFVKTQSLYSMSLTVCLSLTFPFALTDQCVE